MEPKSPKLTLTPEELEKVSKAKARHKGAEVDSNWLFVAEFGYYYGWQGVQAILNNEITMDQANVLMQGAIKVWYGKLVQQAETTHIAMVASRSKKGKEILKKGLENFRKNMKADV